MENARARAPKRRLPIALSILAILEAGCAATAGANRPEPGLDAPTTPEPRSDSGTTLGTDPATVKPGRTIAPPSLGIDLSESGSGKGCYALCRSQTFPIGSSRS